MPTVDSGSRIASPLLGWSSPAMILSRLDLPVPLGPTTPILAPCRNDKVTLSRTTLSPWALRTLRSVKTYSAMIVQPTGLVSVAPNRHRGRSGRTQRRHGGLVRSRLGAESRANRALELAEHLLVVGGGIVPFHRPLGA